MLSGFYCSALDVEVKPCSDVCLNSSEANRNGHYRSDRHVPLVIRALNVPKGWFLHFYIVGVAWHSLLLAGTNNRNHVQSQLLSISHMCSLPPVCVKKLPQLIPCSPTGCLFLWYQGTALAANTLPLCLFKTGRGSRLSIESTLFALALLTAQVCPAPSCLQISELQSVASMGEFHCLLSLCVALLLQTARRTWESVYLKAPSDAQMHITQYIVGLAFYVGAGLAVVAESPFLSNGMYSRRHVI